MAKWDLTLFGAALYTSTIEVGENVYTSCQEKQNRAQCRMLNKDRRPGESRGPGFLHQFEGAAKIRARVTRAEMGNLGDHRTVGQGVIELKIDFGPGYRVYVGLHGDEVVVLLCAGEKSTQHKDIANAHEYWKDYRRIS